MNALHDVLYAVLILVLAPPRYEPYAPAPAPWDRVLSPVAGLLALASAYALPWSGVPLIPSITWFPLALAALLLAPAYDEREGFFRVRGGRALAIACVGALLWTVRGFMLRIGTPGELYSLEGMGAVFRLESLGAWPSLAQGALFLGLAAAFARAGLGTGRAGALVLFSCAGFLTTVFASPLIARAALALGVEQPYSTALQVGAALVLSAALGRLLLMLQDSSVGARHVLALAAVFLVLTGCGVLFWYR